MLYLYDDIYNILYQIRKEVYDIIYVWILFNDVKTDLVLLSNYKCDRTF